MALARSSPTGSGRAQADDDATPGRGSPLTDRPFASMTLAFGATR